MIRFSPPYIDDDVIKEVTTILQSGWLTTDPATRQLEKEIVTFCHTERIKNKNKKPPSLEVLPYFLN